MNLKKSIKLFSDINNSGINLFKKELNLNDYYKLIYIYLFSLFVIYVFVDFFFIKPVIFYIKKFDLNY